MARGIAGKSKNRRRTARLIKAVECPNAVGPPNTFCTLSEVLGETNWNRPLHEPSRPAIVVTCARRGLALSAIRRSGSGTGTTAALREKILGASASLPQRASSSRRADAPGWRRLCDRQHSIPHLSFPRFCAPSVHGTGVQPEHALLSSLPRGLAALRAPKERSAPGGGSILGGSYTSGSSCPSVVMPPGARLVIASLLRFDTRPTPHPAHSCCTARRSQPVWVADARRRC
jgi:hypothetical protein